MIEYGYPKPQVEHVILSLSSRVTELVPTAIRALASTLVAPQFHSRTTLRTTIWQLRVLLWLWRGAPGGFVAELSLRSRILPVGDKIIAVPDEAGGGDSVVAVTSSDQLVNCYATQFLVGAPFVV